MRKPLSRFKKTSAGLVGLLVALASAAQAVELPAGGSPIRTPQDEAPSASPTAPIALSPSQIFTLPAEGVQRIAIGNPSVLDVTIVSPNELLLQAKGGGTSDLFVWDAQGQRQFIVSVVDPQSTAAADQLMELKEILQQLELGGVNVTMRGDRYFLSGSVDSEAQFAQIEQLVTTYGESMVNLVTVRPTMPPAEPETPLVRLSVQVLEINRSDLERLGVNWSSDVAVTDETVTADGTLSDALWRWGTTAKRSAISAKLNALVQKNKARILAEPKLVTASGKEARSFVGGEKPVPTTSTQGVTSGTVSTSIDFKPFGVELLMTPTVLPDGRIKTEMEAKISSVDESIGITVNAIPVPGFKERSTKTSLMTSSGETIVVAGLLQSEDSETVAQVPALGGIPVFGRLFRSPEYKNSQSELVIAVTPELVVDEAKLADRTVALEQALASAEVASSVEDPRLRYALMIQDRISKALRYPQREKELNIDGRVKLRLHLFADGTLGRVNVAESSGIEALDLEAVKAAESQSPYPAFPAQVIERELWLEVPVIFRPS